MPDPTGRNVDVTSFVAEMVRDQESLYNAIVLRRKQRGTLLYSKTGGTYPCDPQDRTT